MYAASTLKDTTSKIPSSSLAVRSLQNLGRIAHAYRCSFTCTDAEAAPFVWLNVTCLPAVKICELT